MIHRLDTGHMPLSKNRTDASEPMSPRQNRLLAALTAAELEPLLPHMTLTGLALGTMLYEPGSRMDDVYFPISDMLGVRRPGITQAARKLQAAGVIEYRRGLITVTDRAQLQAHACECYAVVKKETDRLFASPAGPSSRAAATPAVAAMYGLERLSPLLL